MREGDKAKREEGQQGKRKHDRVRITEGTERKTAGGPEAVSRKKAKRRAGWWGWVEGRGGTRKRGREGEEKDASHGDETSKREGGKQKEDICSAPLKNRVF